MAQTTLVTASNSRYVLLLSLAWGDGHAAYYCSDNQALVVGGQGFAPVPSLEVEFDKVHGGAEPTAAKFRVRREEAVPPFDDLASGFAHAEVAASIEECDPADPDATRRHLFAGVIEGKVQATAQRVSGQIHGLKHRLTAVMSLPALTSCPWWLGDANTCQKDMAGLIEDACLLVGTHEDGKATRVRLLFLEPSAPGFTLGDGSGETVPAHNAIAVDAAGTLLGVEAAPVTATGRVLGDGEGNPFSVDGSSTLLGLGSGTTDATGNMLPPDRRWRTGYLQYDGLRIMVRQSLVDGRFDLHRVPPWAAGIVITAHPGCDGHLTTCREEYDNEINFGGIGIGMPARNPLYEDTA